MGLTPDTSSVGQPLSWSFAKIRLNFHNFSQNYLMMGWWFSVGCGFFYFDVLVFLFFLTYESNCRNSMEPAFSSPVSDRKGHRVIQHILWFKGVFLAVDFRQALHKSVITATRWTEKNNLLNLEETGIPPPPKSQSRQFVRLGKADTAQNWPGCWSVGRWGREPVLLVKSSRKMEKAFFSLKTLFLLGCKLM